jgi:methyl-accepting chemotaxis protein
MLGAFGVVAALLLVVGGIGFWGSLAQSNAATSRTHLDDVVRQVDLIRYYDADVSGWQVSVAFDAHTGGKLTSQDSSRVAEMADKAALDKMLPRFPVKDLTPSEARLYRQIVGSWGWFWRVDKQIFDLYVKGDRQSFAQADKLTNGPATDSFTALSDETLALSKAVNARSLKSAHDTAATGSTVRLLIVLVRRWRCCWPAGWAGRSPAR